MEQDRNGTEWISEFLEWTFGESDRSLAELRAHADAMMATGDDGEFADAYFEWIDATPVATAVRSQFAYDRRGVASDADALGASREVILLMALRAEADCVHMLRQALEADGFEREWPAALDSVASGVRALAGKVLEMHPR